MKALHSLAFILVIIGGLNWLLYVVGWDIGSFVPSFLADIVYVLVGLSSIYLIVEHKKSCKYCESKSTSDSIGM